MGPINNSVADVQVPTEKSKPAWLDSSVVVICSLLACGAILWFSVSENTTFQRNMVRDQQAQLQIIAHSQAQVLEDTFRNVMTQLEVHAHSAGVIRMAAKSILDSQIPNEEESHTYHIYEHLNWLADSIYRLDAKGTVLARVPFRENLEGSDFSRKPGVAEVLRTKRPVVSRAFLAYSNRSALTVCVPVFRRGKLVGILRALTYLDHLKQMIQPHQSRESFNFSWIDDDGTILQSPRSRQIGKNGMVCEHDCVKKGRRCTVAIMAKVREGESWSEGQSFLSFESNTCNPDGEKQILAVTPLNLDGRQTYAIMSTDKHSIMAPIMQHRRRMTTAALLIGVLVIGCMFYILRRLSHESADQATHLLLEETVRERTKDLEAARHKAEQADEAKSEFLASMSHEIRTPLNAVIGFAQILERVTTDQSHRQYITSIRMAANNLMVLINDILDLSKAQAGMVTISPEPMRIRRFLGEIKRLYGTQAAQKKLCLDVRVDDSIPEMLLLDEARIRQVLVNLVGNAIKFTEEGFIRISVSMERGCDEGECDLFISVRDTGIGIPQEEQELIFESFVQAKAGKQARHNGTGLGLSITRKLVEAMDGRISVMSDPGRGSAFIVLLKGVQVCTKVASSIASDHQYAEDLRFDGALVLIADDDPSNRQIFSQMLQLADLTVCEATDGTSAVQIAKKQSPLVIIMDLLMPLEDGFSAAKRLRSDKDTANIPIIALSACPTLEFENQDMTLFTSYLQKPVSSEQIYGELAKLLPHHFAPTILAAGRAGELFSEDTTECHPALMQQLQEEVAPRILEIQGALRIRDIMELGQQIQSMGKTSDSEFWTDIGERLSSFANHFDKNGMDSSLKEITEALSRNHLISSSSNAEAVSAE